VDTFSIIGTFVGAALFLGLGIFALVMSIKGLASTDEPDISVSSSGGTTKVGRPGLFVFLILGVLAAIVGVALLIAGIKGATS
jgi:hypothetical protein